MKYRCFKSILFVTVAAIILTSCGEETGDKKGSEKSSGTEIPKAEKLISFEQISAIFNLPGDVKFTIDDQSDSHGEMVRINWNYYLPEDVVNEFADSSEMENQYLEISYMYSGKATYKTIEDAENFLKNKLKNEPESYSAFSSFPVTAAHGELNSSFVFNEYIIDLGASLRYDETARRKYLELVAKQIYENLNNGK